MFHSRSSKSERPCERSICHAQRTFQLAYIAKKDKIKAIELTFWADDAKQDVICTYKFRGWISNYVTATGTARGSSEGDATNHVLTLTLQPELDQQQYVKINLGN